MSEKCKQASTKYRNTDGDFSKHCKQVSKYDTEGNKLETYISISEAAKKIILRQRQLECTLEVVTTTKILKY